MSRKSGQASGYQVGYGKPPREHQFAQGVSGNPRGRPRKGREDAAAAGLLAEIVLAETERTITAVDGQREVRLTMMEAIVRRTFQQAVKGDARARGDVIKFLGEALVIQERRAERERQALERSRAMERPISPEEAQRVYLEMIRATAS